MQVLLEPALLSTSPLTLCISVIGHIRKMVGFKEPLYYLLLKNRPKQFKELWSNITCLDLTDLIAPLPLSNPIKRAYSGLQDYASLQFESVYQPVPLIYH